MAYSAPHWPLQAKPEDIAKYDGAYDEGWHAIRESRFAKQKQLGPYRCLKHSWANASNAPFREYKLYTHEGGPRTACVVRWPAGIATAGGWTDDVGHIIDLQPTFMALGGTDPIADLPEGKRPLDGKNILPILQEKHFDRGAPLYWEWLGSKAIRDGDWKAVQLVSSTDYRWELYNLKDDPTELNDLAKAHPERLWRIRLDWAQWAAVHGAPLEQEDEVTLSEPVTGVKIIAKPSWMRPYTPTQ